MRRVCTTHRVRASAERREYFCRTSFRRVRWVRTVVRAVEVRNRRARWRRDEGAVAGNGGGARRRRRVEVRARHGSTRHIF